MTLRVDLVRHGHHPLVGRVICGRMPGVEIDAKGAQEIAAAARWLDPAATVALQSSPQRRCVQSAAILAERLGLAVELVPAFDEIEMGRWTGMALADLEADPDWRRWNAARDRAAPPGGESMRALQRRVVRHIAQLAALYDDAAVTIVSHAEPIRAALMHFVGVPLQDFLTVEVDCASVSTLLIDGRRVQVARLNGRVTA